MRVVVTMATQLLAALGTCVTVIDTPGCGLVTVAVKPVIDVVPGASELAMLKVLVVVAEPPQTRLRLASVQALGAPGYSAPSAATSALVTLTPLIVVGAWVVQLHTVGHAALPGSEVLPVSITDQVREATVGVKL